MIASSRSCEFYASVKKKSSHRLKNCSYWFLKSEFLLSANFIPASPSPPAGWISLALFWDFSSFEWMQKKYDWQFLLNVKYVWNAAWGFPLSNRKLLYFTCCTEWENFRTSVHCLKVLRSASLNSECVLEFILVCSFFSCLHLQRLLQRDFTEVSSDLNNQHHVVSEWLRSCFVFEPCFRALGCNSKWQSDDWYFLLLC